MIKFSKYCLAKRSVNGDRIFDKYTANNLAAMLRQSTMLMWKLTAIYLSRVGVSTQLCKVLPVQTYVNGACKCSVLFII